MEETVQIPRDISSPCIRTACICNDAAEKKALTMLQSCLEIRSVLDFVLVTFPRTWAPNNLKYCFSKSGSSKFHLNLELKNFPMHPCCHPETELPVSLTLLSCLVSVLFPNGSRNWKKNTLSVGYCLIHIHSTPVFYIYLLWTTERNSFHWWGERFCERTNGHSELFLFLNMMSIGEFWACIWIFSKIHLWPREVSCLVHARETRSSWKHWAFQHVARKLY